MPSVLQAASASQFGFWGRGGLLRASVDVSLLPVVEACVVAAVRGRVGEVRVAADEATAPRLPESDTTPAVAWSPSHACGPWHGEFSAVSPHGRIVRQLILSTGTTGGHNRIILNTTVFISQLPCVGG